VARTYITTLGLVLVLVGSIGCATHYSLTPRERFAFAVSEYLEMRDQALRDIAPLEVTSDPSWLASHVDQLASTIQHVRRGLQQGVLFSRPVAQEFRILISNRMSAPDGPQLARAILEVQPRAFTPHVNDRYPVDEPRPTMPAPVLEILPPVPPVLEYRFVGRDLLLMDRATGIVLDILPSALPA